MSCTSSDPIGSVLSGGCANRGRRIGYVFQDARLFPALCVTNFPTYPGVQTGSDHPVTVIATLLDRRRRIAPLRPSAKRPRGEFLFCSSRDKRISCYEKRVITASRPGSKCALADRQLRCNTVTIRPDYEGTIATDRPRLLSLPAITHCAG